MRFITTPGRRVLPAAICGFQPTISDARRSDKGSPGALGAPTAAASLDSPDAFFAGIPRGARGRTVERRGDASGDRHRRRRGERLRRRLAVIRSTRRKATSRVHGSGRCTSEAQASWLRCTASLSAASSSCGGTISPIWSGHSKRRTTFPTRPPSAASGWAKQEFASCCSDLHHRPPTSSASQS